MGFKRRKKILFAELNNDGTVGGSHYCLYYLIKSLDRSKIEPTVLFYEENVLVGKFREIGCHVIIFNKPHGRKIRRTPWIPSAVSSVVQKTYNFFNVNILPTIRFTAMIRRENYDLIELNNTALVGWEWIFAARINRIKCITHERGLDSFDRLSRWFANRFDKIICMSSAIQDSLQYFGIHRNVIMIYDGMDPAEFKVRIKKEPLAVRAEFGISSNQPFVAVIGNFQRWKGQITVVRAIEIIKKTHDNIQCLLVGNVSSNNCDDKNFYKEIEREIFQRKLEKNITITGYRSDVADIINALDVQIHSSIEPEPFGMVILEGMCLGKTLIATDIGGPREIIENGISGFLVPPKNPEILADQLQKVLSDKRFRDQIGANAVVRVESVFSIEKFKHNMAYFYENFSF